MQREEGGDGEGAGGGQPHKKKILYIRIIKAVTWRDSRDLNKMFVG